MISKKSKVKAQEGIIHIQLPDEFKDKIVDVVVQTEDEIIQKLLLDTIQLDTTGWKFNRDEICGG
jgi:hypothetical protein